MIAERVIDIGRIIAVANQKGGVGKTTTCVNLVCALHNAGKKVLLCDMDPQGNSTSGMGMQKSSRGVYDVLINEELPEFMIKNTRYGDILPSNKELSGAGIELVNLPSREFVLKNALSKIKGGYDYIFIDCPPSLELLTLNSLCAADSVLVPVQCEYYALEGLSDLLNTIKAIKKSLNPSLEIEGVLLTMFSGNNNLSFQVADEVKKFFKSKVYNTVIPRNVRLSEAPSHKKPCVIYDRKATGSVAYTELAREIIRKNS